MRLSNGLMISQIGVGTWTLRGETARQNVRMALQAGFRHVDTAQMYENESEVGLGIANSGVSNFNRYHLDDLLSYAEIRPVINQIEVHPLMTQEEKKKDLKNENKDMTNGELREKLALALENMKAKAIEMAFSRASISVSSNLARRRFRKN